MFIVKNKIKNFQFMVQLGSHHVILTTNKKMNKLKINNYF